jgi:Ca2+-binding RTX toxin-like protein
MGRLRVLLIGSLVASALGTATSEAAVPRCRGARATIVGTDGRDVLRGTPRRDVIVGRAGNDRILGSDGSDRICGNIGRDEIRGGRGSDRIFGGGSNDRMYGGPGSDRFDEYDAGDDLFDGGPGLDLLHMGGGPKARRVTVDLGEGFMRAGAGRDRLAPGTFEVVYGTENPDVLRGDDEANILFAGFGSGDDTLIGRGGDDYLYPEPNGENVLRAGSGNDVLHLPYPYETNRENVIAGGDGRDVLVASLDEYQNCTDEPPNIPFGITVNLTTGEAPSATISGVEDVTGTQCPDTLIGSDGPNRLYGADDGDDIQGRGGDDDLRGDDASFARTSLMRRWYGPVTFQPGDGDDTVDGGDGTDTVDGGPGTDTCTNWETQQNCEP